MTTLRQGYAGQGAANQAVFLSYASQDAAVVERIAEALRAAGVEVWFDRNELVGGDAWDAKIRKQIAECALFVPVISTNTQARLEGYFRLEWKLAAQRTHMMAEAKPFLLPVVIDATGDAEAHVPTEFKAVQWTRLPAGETSAAFGAQVQRLLGSEVRSGTRERVAAPAPPCKTLKRSAAENRPSAALWSMAALGVLATAGYFFFRSADPATPKATTAGAEPHPRTAEQPAAAPADKSAPAEKSLVVLPLENLSPDPEMASFTDGIHWDIISTLSRIPDLKVISRDSAIALRAAGGSLADKAGRAGVANVMTGSVRRAGDIVRIQLELRRASDEAVLWSLPQKDQPLKEVLSLQDEIANEVARALQAREARGSYASAQFMTRNPAAFDLFNKATALIERDAATSEQRQHDLAEVIRCAETALTLDPTFMTAASFASATYVFRFNGSADIGDRLRFAREAKRFAELASRLAPGGAGDAALAYYFLAIERDNQRAVGLLEGALRALPNEALSHNRLGMALSRLKNPEAALVPFRRALELDPLNGAILLNYTGVLSRLRRLPEFERTVARVAPGFASQQLGSMQRFMLTGGLPSRTTRVSPNQINAIDWLIRGRHWSDALAAADAALKANASPNSTRFEYLLRRSTVLTQMGRATEALADSRAAHAIAEKIQAEAEIDPSEKDGRMARVLALVGNAEGAIAAGRRYVAAIAPENQQLDYWSREITLAGLHARLGQHRECCEMLARLLRVPSGLTVPMLKVDPAWDNVRDDPAFQALLADPKNSAPL